ncbi:uncharacterized protein G2W53_035706 [Senna tora]|uniref:Uncharacterized protein n=1 Tax=Senna tora TaxID=362788 RepID=A0A834ST79_9FABA|nr:uncharacterized protein G2W53_035706 [Senna tora]
MARPKHAQIWGIIIGTKAAK